MYLKNKRILVTGGAGVIGRSLINKLVTSDAQVTCLDKVQKPSDIPESVEYKRIDLSEIDSDYLKKFDPQIVFHLAATFERSEESPEFWEENYKNNIVLSHKVVDAAKKCNNMEKFIFASSYLIYSPNLYLYSQPQSTPKKLKETDLVHPRNLCGGAKYYTENELEFVNEMNPNFIGISARIYRVYGLGSRDVISRWVRMALSGEELNVFQKRNMFDYIFAGDVAEGLIKMGEKVNKSEIINLGTGNSRRIEKIVSVMKSYIPNIRIKESDTNGLYEASCADTCKLISLTGWKPQIMIEEGIKKVIDYEKNMRPYA